MKNKDGFTLVELLAVIAILAILVIIALPNVISMYNRAQKQTFLTEAKKVYSEAEKKYLTNAISGKNTKVINSEDSSKLDMTGKKLQYCVILNNNGKVTDMKVSNGKWVASLKGKTIEDLTIDDLEDGNLDDYECVSATDESCFTYEVINNGEEYGTPAITIENVTKCKNYLMSDSVDAPEDIATTLCNGDLYKTDDGAYTIQDIVLNDFLTKDYKNMGLSLNHIMIEKVEVVDTAKCKNHLQSKFGLEENESTTLCTTNESVMEINLFQIVYKGYISFLSYEKAGLKVTSRNLTIPAIITGYNINCGTDVVIPSKINGYDVIGINDDAFINCNIPMNSKINSSEYNVRFLDYKISDENIIKKTDASCFSTSLSSVVLPKGLLYIGSYSFAGNNLKSIVFPVSIVSIGNHAFAYNKLIELTIPSSVRTIENYAFAHNNLRAVTYNGNESDISFGYCPYYGNYNYSGVSKNCGPR